MDDVHVWDEETERAKHYCADRGWDSLDYLTLCGAWVDARQVESDEEQRRRGPPVNCTACVLLRFERDAHA